MSSHKLITCSCFGLLFIGLFASSATAVLVVDSDQRLSDPGVIDSHVVNHGVIAGTSANRFVFGPLSHVSGSGHFEETLNFGTFAPGNSPGITTGLNQAFGGTIEIELGGTSPGFGTGKHDQINDSGTIELIGAPTLSILSFDGYVPDNGDEFVILTWTTGLVGSFGDVTFDPAFSIAGITFQQVITNTAGVGNFKLVAIPEASAVLVWTALMLCGLLRFRFLPQWWGSPR